MESLKPFLKKGQILILESTTYPGTTEDIIKPALEDIGFTVGEDIFLVYSPEREDPGNKEYNSHNTPKILEESPANVQQLENDLQNNNPEYCCCIIYKGC